MKKRRGAGKSCKVVKASGKLAAHKKPQDLINILRKAIKVSILQEKVNKFEFLYYSRSSQIYLKKFTSSQISFKIHTTHQTHI